MPIGEEMEHLWNNYHRASVVEKEKAPWFKPREMRKETCCVETVAIELDQEKYQIINTRDGLDLADVIILQQQKKQDDLKPEHLLYVAQTLTSLVPGTIIGRT
jgi:hypothetical protein